MGETIEIDGKQVLQTAKAVADEAEKVRKKIVNKKGGSKGERVARTIAGILMANSPAKVIEAIKQHPEWYLHYSTSALVALNLATKQNIAFPDTGAIKMPVAAQVEIHFIKPRGDYDGWESGIRLLYQQLRTANSGNANYQAPDVEKYVWNTRFGHALCMWLQRLYKATYTFTSTNDDVPRAFIEAMGVDFDDIMANASNLFMYQQRFIEQIRVNLPLNLDLFTRTRWIMRNIFADSDSPKKQYYVPTFAAETADTQTNLPNYVYGDGDNIKGYSVTWGNPYQLTFGTKMTYAEILSLCETFKDIVINSQSMAIIAGDIIKAFGDRAFCRDLEPAEIDEVLVSAFDPYILNQWQNANVLSWDMVNTPSVASEPLPDYNYDYGFSYAHAATGDDWIVPSSILRFPAVLPNRDTFRQSIIDKINTPLINWHATTITAGEVMSITRFMATGAQVSADDDAAIELTITGTEVVTNVYAITKFVPTNPGQAPMYIHIPIGGNIMTYNNDASVGNAVKDASYSYFLWSIYDYAPKLRIFSYYVDASGTNYTQDSNSILDYDVFAVADTYHLATYFSYGNQSLLYADVSQNQSNTAVYKTNTGDKNIDNVTKFRKKSNTSVDTRHKK